MLNHQIPRILARISATRLTKEKTEDD